MTSKPVKTPGAGPAKNLAKGLAILDVVAGAGGGLTLAEIGRFSGVPKPIAHRILTPFADGVTVGPVHTGAVAGALDRHVADLIDRGSEVVSGGGRADGFPTRLYYEPTIADAVPAGSPAVLEETFGPLVPVVRLPDDEAVLRAANAGRHGLVAAVFTTSLSRAFRFSERIEAGTVVVNDTSNYWELHLPFGGRAGRESGRGRLGGRHTLEEFTQLKTVSLDVS